MELGLYIALKIRILINNLLLPVIVESLVIMKLKDMNNNIEGVKEDQNNILNSSNNEDDFFLKKS